MVAFVGTSTADPAEPAHSWIPGLQTIDPVSGQGNRAPAFQMTLVDKDTHPQISSRCDKGPGMCAKHCVSAVVGGRLRAVCCAFPFCSSPDDPKGAAEHQKVLQSTTGAAG